MRVLLYLLMVISVAFEARAAELPNIDYFQCTTLVGSAPEQAITFARDWRRRGDTIAAQHCEAMALFSAKHYSEAAASLDTLAKRLEGNPSMRIGVLQQSARALDQAGKRPEALDRLGQALALASRNPEDAALQRKQVEVLIDRAALSEQYGQPLEGIQDLDQALSLGVLKDQVLLARAGIEARMGERDLAERDIREVLKANPSHSAAQALLQEIVAAPRRASPQKGKE